MNVDQALNDYMRDQISVKSSKVRAIIWNELPSDEMLENYFNTHFKIIKYDETYRDLVKKNFDYTRQTTLSDGRTWEKFLFVRIQDEFITLFFSYTMKWSIFYYLPFMNTASTASLNIEKFATEVSVRMFNKLFHPTKSIYSHGSPLLNDKSTIQYFLVHYDSRDGYIERIIPSFKAGLKEQEKIDKRKLSSCILIIRDGQKSLHSIRHPIIPGNVVPDFHGYYGIHIEKRYSTIHDDL